MASAACAQGLGRGFEWGKGAHLVADHGVLAGVGEDALEGGEGEGVLGLSEAVGELVLEEGGVVVEAWGARAREREG